MAVNTSGRWMGLAVASVVLAMGLKTGAQELFSESVYVPPLVDRTPYAATNLNGWNDLNILLSDDPGMPAQDATDTNTDPYAVNGTSTITISNLYTPNADATGDFLGPGPVALGGMSRVQFSGTTPINQGNIPNQNVGNSGPYVQFGLTGPANNHTMNFVAQNWIGSSTLTLGKQPIASVYLHAAPIVSVTPHPRAATPPAGENFDYIIDYIHFTQMDYANAAIGATSATVLPVGTPISVSEWVEFPYVPGQQPTFTYSGWGSTLDPIHFIDSEIQLSPTEIPLDDLNYADDPPLEIDPEPAGGTTFSSEVLPQDIVDPVPEPGAAIAGIGGLLILPRRRRR